MQSECREEKIRTAKKECSMKTYHDHKIGFESRRSSLSRHSAGAIKEMQLAKSDAYAMAEHYLAMEALDQPALLADLKARFPVRDPFDAMVREDFAPYVAIGGDAYELFAFVRAGGTRKDFLASAVLLSIGGKKKVSPKPATAIPPAPDESADANVQLRIWRERAAALERQLARMREVERENARLRQRIARIEKIIQAESPTV